MFGLMAWSRCPVLVIDARCPASRVVGEPHDLHSRKDTAARGSSSQSGRQRTLRPARPDPGRCTPSDQALCAPAGDVFLRGLSVPSADNSVTAPDPGSGRKLSAEPGGTLNKSHANGEVRPRASARARLRPKAQLTLPDEIRRALHVSEGDEIEFAVDESGNITVRGYVSVPSDQAWFFTPDQLVAKHQAEEEITSGGGAVHASAKAMFAYLERSGRG